MAALHFPVPDLTSPSHAMVTELINRLQERLQAGERIAVHCNAGVGRTSVILACVVKRLQGIPGAEAAARVCQFLHINMTDEQQRFVSKWDDELAPDQPVLSTVEKGRRVQP